MTVRERAEPQNRQKCLSTIQTPMPRPNALLPLVVRHDHRRCLHSGLSRTIHRLKCDRVNPSGSGSQAFRPQIERQRSGDRPISISVHRFVTGDVDNLEGAGPTGLDIRVQGHTDVLMIDRPEHIGSCSQAGDDRSRTSCILISCQGKVVVPAVGVRRSRCDNLPIASESDRCTLRHQQPSSSD